MSAVENDPGWYERMAQRAQRRRVQAGSEHDRENWPVPEEYRHGASARDAFLWYIADGWQKIYGGTDEVEVLFDHDFGYHVLRKGTWELRLVNTEQYPHERWPDEPEPDTPPTR